MQWQESILEWKNWGMGLGRVLGRLRQRISPHVFKNWDRLIGNTYILHLEEREDRFEDLSKELRGINIGKGRNLETEVVWWPAVKIDEIDDRPEGWLVDEYSFQYHWEVDKDPLFKEPEKYADEIIKCSAPEVSIVMGHINMWKDFVKSDYRTALFMEDDVKFAPEFEEKLESIMEDELPEDFDILYVSAMPLLTFDWEHHTENVAKLNGGVWWMSGYILSKQGAQKLLDLLPVIGPIDLWINHQFKHLNSYISRGNLIEQSDGNGSDNQYSFEKEYYG